jgi:hypothetical protein
MLKAPGSRIKLMLCARTRMKHFSASAGIGTWKQPHGHISADYIFSAMQCIGLKLLQNKDFALLGRLPLNNLKITIQTEDDSGFCWHILSNHIPLFSTVKHWTEKWLTASIVFWQSKSTNSRTLNVRLWKLRGFMSERYHSKWWRTLELVTFSQCG